MDFKNYLKNFKERIGLIEKVFGSKKLILGLDNLCQQKIVDHELLYFKYEKSEEKGIFVFGYDFFIKELSEQEFKKTLTYDSLNFRIYEAYRVLKKKQKVVKVSEILNYIQNLRKDSMAVNKILNRILSLSYYMNWKLERDSKDIEGDFIIEKDDVFLRKLKQRFDLNVLNAIYENNHLFIFLNLKGNLTLIFKDLKKFNKKDLEKLVFPALIEVFSVKSIEFSN
ncbi:MAG: hypothetical protein KC550_01120 [Nanoarchaeota archaeon]|nr:hypothetical protein [Nanoarchaeota archaeon]